MSLLVVYYTFLQHTLNKPEDSCYFACSTGVVLHALVVAVCIVVAAIVVVVDGVVVAAIAQLRVDKNMLDANYEEGDIGDFQDAFDDGKNP